MSISRFASIASTVLVLASCSGDISEPKPKVDPSFSISTHDTLVVQTSKDGQKVVFTVTVVGAKPSETTWTVDGQPRGMGARFEPVLQAGTYEVCGHNTGMRDCETVRIELPAVAVEWYVAQSVGGEFLATGTAVTVSANGAEERVHVEGSKFSVRPTFLASAEQLRICLEVEVYPRCVEVAREKFFSPVYALSVAESWRIERGLYTGNVESISMELGYAQSGMILNDSTRMAFFRNPARSLSPSTELSIYIAMDSVFTSADSAMIVEVLQATYNRLGYGSPKFVSKDVAHGLAKCQIVEVRGNSTLQSGGLPESCVHASKVTGGYISLGRYRRGDGTIKEFDAKTMCALKHEFGHVIGLQHTNSWDSVMNDAPYCTAAYEFTSYDVAMVHAMERVMELIDKYPHVEYGPIQPWATWYGYQY